MTHPTSLPPNHEWEEVVPPVPISPPLVVPPHIPVPIYPLPDVPTTPNEAEKLPCFPPLDAIARENTPLPACAPVSGFISVDRKMNGWIVFDTFIFGRVDDLGIVRVPQPEVKSRPIQPPQKPFSWYDSFKSAFGCILFSLLLGAIVDSIRPPTPQINHFAREKARIQFTKKPFEPLSSNALTHPSLIAYNRLIGDWKKKETGDCKWVINDMKREMTTPAARHLERARAVDVLTEGCLLMTDGTPQALLEMRILILELRVEMMA